MEDDDDPLKSLQENNRILKEVLVTLDNVISKTEDTEAKFIEIRNNLREISAKLKKHNNDRKGIDPQ